MIYLLLCGSHFFCFLLISAHSIFWWFLFFPRDFLWIFFLQWWLLTVGSNNSKSTWFKKKKPSRQKQQPTVKMDRLSVLLSFVPKKKWAAAEEWKKNLIRVLSLTHYKRSVRNNEKKNGMIFSFSFPVAFFFYFCVPEPIKKRNRTKCRSQITFFFLKWKETTSVFVPVADHIERKTLRWKQLFWCLFDLQAWFLFGSPLCSRNRVMSSLRIFVFFLIHHAYFSH